MKIEQAVELLTAASRIRWGDERTDEIRPVIDSAAESVARVMSIPLDLADEPDPVIRPEEAR